MEINNTLTEELRDRGEKMKSDEQRLLAIIRNANNPEKTMNETLSAAIKVLQIPPQLPLTFPAVHKTFSDASQST